MISIACNAEPQPTDKRRPGKTYTFPTEMPLDHAAALRRTILVHLHQLFPPLESDVGFHEAIVVGEGRSSDFPAVAAMADDGAFVDACDGQAHAFAEAGEGR